ncbi:MAG: hypothetical protein C0483_14755 [Pirellula sp.]|nr:hypothetical protein [Pirellula sp.]
MMIGARAPRLPPIQDHFPLSAAVRLLTALFALLAIGGSCSCAISQARADEAAIEFDRDIRPLLSDRCFRCHGPDAASREAELRLDLRDAAVADRNGTKAITPGNPSASEFYRRITATGDEQMPPADSNLKLSKAEIDLLRRWIESGAEYKTHWSFAPPQAGAPPSVRKEAWVKNEVDRFVLAALERREMATSPEASKATWLRRVSIDLTGVPPTPAELDAFLADDKPQAYERVADRLLASPRFGERMALDWLDAARFADTNGYYNDSERQAWPWRDWVIRAFNSNMPFDRFTVEQLAGDLLPNPTLDQRIATGFNRNHMVTNETGIIDEEYRIGYVVDRVDTTASTWLGLTVGCARCHDHKYDPISQREYYSLFAFFNGIAETGLVKDVEPLSPSPNIELPSPEQDRRLAEIRAERTECEMNLKKLRPALTAALNKWEPTALQGLPELPTAGTEFYFPLNGDGIDAGPQKLKTNISGTLASTAGVRGEAVAFDGTQYVECADGPKIERDRPFSLSLWIRPGNAPSGCVISRMDGTAEAPGFEIIWYKSQPRINFVHHWGRDTIEVVAQEKFSGKQWRHLAVAYDGSGKAAGFRIFVDGKATQVDVRRDTLTGSTATAEPWRIAWKATGVGFDGSIDELRFFNRPLSDDEATALYWRDLLEGAIETPVADRSRQQTEQLEAYYVERHGSDDLRQWTRRVAELRKGEESERGKLVVASVMQEMEKPRATHVLTRGQYDQPGEQVEAGVPAVLGQLDAAAPRNRLTLARWLVSPEHPLTARVAVNRYWRQCFGEGLVRTDGDFGLQGEAPTHPELLDWLAIRFVKSGWDVKSLFKLLVTSAAYRQSSHFTAQLREHDPENRLLARGPRYRLPAELIRDQALALGGLLVEHEGGESVKPYQPPGLWEAVSYNGGQTYVTDEGEDRYRRGIYTYWKRQAPPPNMLAFDAPTREVCTIRRARTNTPLQALVLLNDPVFVEAARGLAVRTLRDGPSDTASRVRFAFRIATARLPTPVEADALERLYLRQRKAYRERKPDAAAVSSIGESPKVEGLDAEEVAAWTAVAGVLLNLDEVVTQN